MSLLEEDPKQVLLEEPESTPKWLVTLKTVATLLVLTLLMPLSLLATCTVYVYHTLLGESPQGDCPPNKVKTVMLTGAKMTKCLQLARLFWKAGHRVVMVESHKYWLTGHRYSRAVSKFHTVPAPEKDPEGYAKALVDLAIEENVDIFVPVSSPASSVYSAMAKERLQKHCEVLHFDYDDCRTLDDKYLFCAKARALGLPAPQVHLITSPEQLASFDFSAPEHVGRQYIIKSICYDSVTRLDLTRLPCPNIKEFAFKLPITKAKPWVLQEFVKGKEYCSHSLCRDGKVVLHCCSESSAFQVNYKNVDKPKITQWVQKLAEEMKLTGQASFDFIETPGGDVFPIECNPRTHSAITTFHDHPGLAHAYLEAPAKGSHEIAEPLKSSKPTYWLAHELFRLTQAGSMAQMREIMGRITNGKEAMLHPEDPLPFLMVHHWHVPLLLLKALWHGKEWVRIDFNIGKLVEVGGD
eukprot:jgi/Bigna1/37936/e_gw1.22.24.1